ncbi:MAG: hypothetical protein KBT34_02310, partial [Prevotella sp.]|nr:hypothetical protein [Candidatus Prevotella equi]
MYKRISIILSLILAIAIYAMAQDVTLTTKGGRYQKITSLDEITNGTIVIIASHSTKDDQDEIKVMTTASTTHTNMFGYYNTHMPYTSDMPDYISVNPVNTTVAGEEQAYEYVITGATSPTEEKKTYYLNDINGKYLNEQNTKELNLVDTKTTKSLFKNISTNREPWKIHNNSSSNFIVIDNYQPTNDQDNGYFCIGGSTTNFNLAYLYKKLDVTTLDFGDYGNATLYYGENDVRLPNDLTAYTLNIKDGKIIIEHIFYGGTVIPHGTAVMLS